jgi:hypothetical protein
MLARASRGSWPAPRLHTVSRYSKQRQQLAQQPVGAFVNSCFLLEQKSALTPRQQNQYVAQPPMQPQQGLRGVSGFRGFGSIEQRFQGLAPARKSLNCSPPHPLPGPKPLPPPLRFTLPPLCLSHPRQGRSS